MKNKDKKAEVEFIESGGPLTKEEQLAISAFIRLRKKTSRGRKKSSDRVVTED